MALTLQQPEYSSTFSNSIRFLDWKSFDDEILHRRNKVQNTENVHWIIFCYAEWAYDCTQLSSIFADIAEKYMNNRDMKFAKIDVGKNAGIAKLYKISLKATTKQLPTILLLNFEGKEISRIPSFIDESRMKVKKTPFTVKNIDAILDLPYIESYTKSYRKKCEKKARKTRNVKVKKHKKKK